LNGRRDCKQDQAAADEAVAFCRDHKAKASEIRRAAALASIFGLMTKRTRLTMHYGARPFFNSIPEAANTVLCQGVK